MPVRNPLKLGTKIVAFDLKKAYRDMTAQFVTRETNGRGLSWQSDRFEIIFDAVWR
jgi:hypothetical protein